MSFVDNFQLSPEANRILDEQVDAVIPGFADLPEELKAAALIPDARTLAEMMVPLVAQGATMLDANELFHVMYAVFTGIFDTTQSHPAYNEIGQNLYTRGQQLRAMLDTYRQIDGLDTTDPEDAA